MIKAVPDTNILVSASFWKGNPYKIIQKAISREIKLYSSPEILEEYSRALKRDFKLEENEVNKRTELLLQILEIVKPTKKLQVTKDDPKDNIILETALEVNADYIISGDKHLLNLKEFMGIKIVKAKEFLEKIGD